mmetsp:Transcript_68293/g.61383  ORF Transcript_68293/g.61383 Transcript_68293/m.61383 type:complete len:119 (-) Transcript_68293:28-384(-)
MICGQSGIVLQITKTENASKKKNILKFLSLFPTTRKPKLIGNKSNLKLIKHGLFDDEMIKINRFIYHCKIIESKLAEAPYGIHLPQIGQKKFKKISLTQNMKNDLRKIFMDVMKMAQE